MTDKAEYFQIWNLIDDLDELQSSKRKIEDKILLIIGKIRDHPDRAKVHQILDICKPSNIPEIDLDDRSQHLDSSDLKLKPDHNDRREQLDIKLIREKNGMWTADTNLPGAPPVGRHENWRTAVGILMYLLVQRREVWEQYVHLPKWIVIDDDVESQNEETEAKTKVLIDDLNTRIVQFYEIIRNSPHIKYQDIRIRVRMSENDTRFVLDEMKKKKLIRENYVGFETSFEAMLGRNCKLKRVTENGVLYEFERMKFVVPHQPEGAR